MKNYIKFIIKYLLDNIILFVLWLFRKLLNPVVHFFLRLFISFFILKLINPEPPLWYNLEFLFGWIYKPICNTAPAGNLAAVIASSVIWLTPVEPLIVVVIFHYSYGLGLADFTAVRKACKSVRVSPPSKRAWIQSWMDGYMVFVFDKVHSGWKCPPCLQGALNWQGLAGVQVG